MPYIKSPFGIRNGIKIFNVPGVCWKCKGEIPIGSWNWSYHTQVSGKYAHRDCELAKQESYKTQTPPQIVMHKCSTCAAEFSTASDLVIHKYKEHNHKCNECSQVFDTAEKLAEHKLTHISYIAPALASDITDKIKENNGKHKQGKTIKKLLRRRAYPFLYGAPGAGKTYLAQEIAVEMQLPFTLISCAPDMLKSEILGSSNPLKNAPDNYNRSAFRNAWENGGVILFDECGLSPGSFLNVLNAAMEQKIICFPDLETIKMHNDCFLLFADNSTLYGNDPLFPERQDVGGAFRDRLTYVQFEYDTDLELRVITMRYNGDTRRAKKWHDTVLAIRSALKAQGELPIFASPRFAYKSAVWFQDGFTWDEVMAMELFRGQTPDTVAIAKRITDQYRDERF